MCIRDRFLPESYDAVRAESVLAEIHASGHVTPPDLPRLRFDPARDLVFDYGPALAGHANGMILKATDVQGDVILQETYFSIGGGFVVTEAESALGKAAQGGPRVPHPFESAAQMLEMARATGLTIAQMKRANEAVLRDRAEISQGVERIWAVMNACIERGLTTATDQFFEMYWLLTGFHVAHVMVGIPILLYFAWRIRSGPTAFEADLNLQTGSAFWHMCDLIWVLLLPTVYLV